MQVIIISNENCTPVEERLPRKLAVILHADVVGYSRLAGEDEDATYRKLKELLGLISRTVVSYHGRIVNTAGDAVLAMFEAAVDAVSCAAAVQHDLTALNQDVPDERKVLFRIGINIGDVIEDDGDIYGDGVNVAARLEGLAQPGGICISESVFTAVGSKLPLEYKELGEQNVKNIANSVRAYQVHLKPGSELPQPSEQPKPVHPSKTKRWHPVIAALVLILMVVGAATYWIKPWEPREEPASVENMAYPLPDKPSIAVLPLDNMSDDVSQDYFADGMTEDLITDLSKNSSLFVIARNSSFSYKDRNVEIRQVAEELGVRYVLEGSVRRAGDQVRINAQLIDATTGGHLWAERYDGTIADVFRVQDKITTSIVDALALELTPREVDRVDNLGTENIEAYDAYLLGLSFYYRRTPESFAKARVYFEQAIELDSDYTEAYAALAKIYAQVGWILTYTRALSINSRDADSKARTIIAKVQAVPLADVHVVRSWLALNKYQKGRAIFEAERALELDPNSVDAMEALALAQIYAGHPESGINLAKRVMRQNPTLLASPSLLIGLAEFALGNSERAVEQIELGFELGSKEIRYAGILAAAYAELDRVDKAKQALKVFQQVDVGSPELADAMILFPFSDSDVLRRIASGLELSGIKVWYTVEDGGYMPLLESNKLSSAEIESLLSGSTLEGKRFWGQGAPWGRQQSFDGKVEYSGFGIQSGVPKDVIVISRVEDDMLCERWPSEPEPLELCSLIFRLPDGNARTRWGNYVLVTDTGPNSFNVAQ
jgi:TolB-like protein/class 3 adenylate cyclase